MVPREFVGSARGLTRRIELADKARAPVLHALLDGLWERRARHPDPLPSMLGAVARAWPEVLAPDFRLWLEIEHKRKRLLIREVRCDSSRYRGISWEEGVTEPGIAITSLVLTAAPGVLRLSCSVLAHVSGHAIARHYQRTFDTSDAALLQDLRVLAAVSVPDRFGEACVSAGDGCWRGTFQGVRIGDRVERVLTVQTFVAGPPTEMQRDAA